MFCFCFFTQEKEYPALDFSSCEDDYPDIAMVHVLINEGKWLTAVSVSLLSGP